MAKASGLVAPSVVQLSATESQLRKHWGLLQSAFNGILPSPHGSYGIAADVAQGAYAFVKSRDERFINVRAERAKRQTIAVVPLIEAPEGTDRLWISWTEVWQEARATRSRSFQYVHTNISIYFGQGVNDKKLQLFRIEWAGIDSIREGVVIYPGKWAAHPHWQFDMHLDQQRQILEHRQKIEELEQEFLGDGAKETELDAEIERQLEGDTVKTNLLNWITRVHFASCATWARAPWTGDEKDTSQHAQGPQTLEELRNWVSSSLIYIQREASRLL